MKKPPVGLPLSEVVGEIKEQVRRVPMQLLPWLWDGG